MSRDISGHISNRDKLQDMSESECKKTIGKAQQYNCNLGADARSQEIANPPQVASKRTPSRHHTLGTPPSSSVVEDGVALLIAEVQRVQTLQLSIADMITI